MTSICAVCGNTSTVDVWETPVCADHWNAWIDTAPPPMLVEKKARPEHFDEPRAATPGLEGIAYRQLKPGVLADYYRKWTLRWVENLKAKAQRIA